MLALALVFPTMPFNVYDVLDYQTWAEQLGHSVEGYSN